MLFSPKTWFRNLIAPYLSVVKAEVSGVKDLVLLSEHADADKPNAAVGEQWIRVDMVDDTGSLQGFCGGVPVENEEALKKAAVRTQTSNGILGAFEWL